MTGLRVAEVTDLDIRDAYALVIVYPRRTLGTYDFRALHPPAD